MKHNVLVLDDDPLILKSMTMFLESEGFTVKAVESGEEGIALIRQKIVPFSLAIIDYHMPDLNGPEVIARIRDLDAELPLLGFSGDDEFIAQNESFNSGTLMFIGKDTSTEKLLGVIHCMCREYEKRNKRIDASIPMENRTPVCEKMKKHGIESKRTNLEEFEF